MQHKGYLHSFAGDISEVIDDSGTLSSCDSSEIQLLKADVCVA
jgi:hypothetical protein